MPPDDAKLELIRRIHAAPTRTVIAVTGGGGLALGDLLAVPGASQTVLEAIVPYSTAAQIEFLDSRPEQFVSAATARTMAMAAYRRAVKLRDAEEPSASRERERPVSKGNADQPADPSPPAPLPQGERGELVGIGLTGSLASDRPKRGPHRVHVAAQSDDLYLVLLAGIDKGSPLARRKKPSPRPCCSICWRKRAASTIGRRSSCLQVKRSSVARRRRCPVGSSCSPAARANWRATRLPRLHRRAAGHVPRLVSSAARRASPHGRGRGRTARLPGRFRTLDRERREAAARLRRDGRPRAEQFDAATRIWFTRAPRMVQKGRPCFPARRSSAGIDTLAARRRSAASPTAAKPRRDRIDRRDRGATAAASSSSAARPPAGFKRSTIVDIPHALRRICDRRAGGGVPRGCLFDGVAKEKSKSERRRVDQTIGIAICLIRVSASPSYFQRRQLLAHARNDPRRVFVVDLLEHVVRQVDAVDVPEPLRRERVLGVGEVLVVGLEEPPVRIQPLGRRAGRRCRTGCGRRTSGRTSAPCTAAGRVRRCARRSRRPGSDTCRATRRPSPSLRRCSRRGRR